MYLLYFLLDILENAEFVFFNKQANRTCSQEGSLGNEKKLNNLTGLYIFIEFREIDNFICKEKTKGEEIEIGER